MGSRKEPRTAGKLYRAGGYADIYSEDVGYFLRISSAMVPALAELDRIREGLDAVVEAAYEQKKEG